MKGGTMDIQLVKFVTQKRKGYEPEIDKSFWYAKAEFSDGTTRTWEGWLSAGQDFPESAEEWTIVSG